jgi:hypothetical protein
LGNISSAQRTQAAAIILRRLYKERTQSEKPVSKKAPLKASRNKEIYDRYIAGERSIDLAREFGVSVRRINKLIRRFQTRGYYSICHPR